MSDDVELEIRITGLIGRQHRATVMRAPRGEGAHLPFDLPEIESVAAGGETWRDIRRRSSGLDRSLLRILTDQGKQLFALVFVREVFSAFDYAYILAREKKAWFRLQFSFELAPLAIDLAWEALVGPDGGALALKPLVSIERRLVSAAAARIWAPRAPHSKLQVLIVGASPCDATSIQAAEEKKWIKAAIGKAADLRLLEHATQAGLAKEVSSEVDFELIHFVGHGDFDGEGGLLLEDELGQADRLTGPELPTSLRRPPRFVFLNVCHGGRSTEAPFAGLADALLHFGVQGVVAMRREVADAPAVELAKHFYREAAKGKTVVRSLAIARGKVGTHQGTWAIPVLYLAGQDFALVSPSPPPAEATAGTPAAPPTELPEGRPRPRIFAALAGLALLAGALAYWLWPEPLPAPCVKPAVVSDTRCPQFPGLDLPLAFVADPGAGLPFCIGKFEITRGQYAAVLRSQAPPSEQAWLPQEGVSWNDGQSFADALQSLNQQASCYLPRDAQWEFVARSGRPEELANCKGDEDGFARVACVGSFAENAWGLYDMTGNVWEWTQDSTWKNRTSLADLPGPEQGDKRIRRGGSYLTVKENCRTTNRAEVQPDRKQEAAGFRIACDPVR